MRLRAWMYAKGWMRSVKLALPVVSVGNLTMGGTGKTPMVIYVTRLLGQCCRPAVISRGYGGRTRQAVNVVSDGRGILLGPEFAGDEPVLIARSLPGVQVLTGAQRAITGKQVEDERGADLIVMDDGFQHLALKRDLDLVLFSAAELLGNGWVFPGGVLREPTSALKRADAFVITGYHEQNGVRLARFKDWIGRAFPATPLFEVFYRSSEFICSSEPESKRFTAVDLQGRRLLAFCGIAKPQAFFSMLYEQGLELVDTKAFVDHHRYTSEDLKTLELKMESLGGEGLLTTEKDFVKLRAMRLSVPLFVSQLVLEAEAGFDEFLLEKVQPLLSC